MAVCQRDNARRCYTAKVLGGRVYIGRSRKRWISAARRSRAKLLRDVFAVSFVGVRVPGQNHGPFVDGARPNGTVEQRLFQGEMLRGKLPPILVAKGTRPTNYHRSTRRRPRVG